jgi:uncharacterized repeat protein (TIGR01451 family)
MAHRCRAFLPLALSILVITPALNLALAQTQESAASVAASNSSSSAAVRLSSAYGKLPLSFERNEGQTDGSVQFLARQAGYTLFLTPGEAVLSLHSSPPRPTKPGIPAAGKQPVTPLTDTVRMEMIGANTKAQVAGLDPLPGKSNYFVGNDQSKWHTDVPTFAKVRYQSVYPGIDLVHYGNQEGRLEHDFIVAPGADPNAIVLSMHDDQGTVAPENGGLTLHTKAGNLTLRNPVVYQEIKGERKTIPATYTLAGNNQIRFKLGSYDRNAPLVIDPVIVYSGLFGGTNIDGGSSIAVDSAGNAYVTGITQTSDFTNFPVVNAFQSHGYNSKITAFVSKINAAGTALVYSTFLACANAECDTFGSGIAVDSTGRAYVVGTVGPDPGAPEDFAGTSLFPVKNAYQSVSGGDFDAFLTVFSPAGDSLVYSTYLGGPGTDSGHAIALDASANAYITGTTLNNGTFFPTLHSIQAQGDIFIAKFNSAGALQYSSILTGAPASPSGIAVDASGSAYITGSTTSTAYPIVQPAFQSTCRACPSGNGFVTKLSPSGERLVYSTYLGGPEGNGGSAIAVDTSGEAYIAGTTGAGFPVTEDAFQKSFGGGSSDAYITKLNATGSGLVYSTYLGGSGDDGISGMALDQYRQVYVTGQTTSPNFPLKAPIPGFTGAGFVTTLSNTGSSIIYYSTYFGPSGGGQVGLSEIAVDKALNVYLTGMTLPGRAPITHGAIDIAGGSYEVFISKLAIEDDLALALSASPSPVAHGGTLTYTIAVTSKGPDFGSNVRISDSLPAGTTFVSYNAGGGKCTAPSVGGTGALNCDVLQLNKGDTWDVKLTVHVNAASGATLSNTATTVSSTQDFTPANNKGTITTRVD